MLSVMENLPIRSSTDRRFDPRRRGVALVMAVVVMGVLILIAGLCIEGGNVMYQRTVLQDGADAAARAGAGMVGKGRDAALDAAYRVLSENAYVHHIDARGASVGLEYGTWSLENRTFTPTNGDKSEADAVRVTVNIPVKPMFVGGATMPAMVATSRAIARRPTLVMVVGDANNLRGNDVEMLKRMKRWGVPTQALSDEKVTSSLFRTEDVVMISSSSSSGVLAGKLAGAPCAVIACELINWPELGLTRGKLGTDYDEFRVADKSTGDPNEAYMNIRSTPETIAFAGRRKVYTGDGMWGWGHPSSDATILATAATDSSKVMAFYYDKGGRLANNAVSPGFRAGLYVRTAEIQGKQYTYSSETWDLFDAMFAKCLPLVNKRVYLVE